MLSSLYSGIGCRSIFAVRQSFNAETDEELLHRADVIPMNWVFSDGLRAGPPDGARRCARIPLALARALLFSAALLPAAGAAQAQQPAPLRTITTAAAAHSLSSKEAARHYPVHLRAVIDFFDTFLGDKNSPPLFVSDATGSIFVKPAHGLYHPLPVGTLIDLQGVSSSGEFSPVVAQGKFKVIGFAGLPAPSSRPSYSRLLTGIEDGQWVEVEGVVHSLIEDDHHVFMQLAMTDGTITVLTMKEAGAAYSNLIDAKLRIRGNMGPKFDLSRSQMIGARIHLPGFSAMQVLEAAPADVFKMPTLPIGRLLQWDMAPLLAHRIHVRGRVTLQWPGASICIRDAKQGICAETDQKTRVVNGELIDLAGFARAEGSAPTLTDAVFQSVGSAAPQPDAPLPVTAEQALQGGHESQLIQIDGQLISRDLASPDTTLLLSSGKSVFTAILPQGLGGPGETAWKVGSVLRLTGICSVQLDARRSNLNLGTAVPRSFRVLLRAPGDVVVLQRPSWWTLAHMVLVLTLALTGTLAVLAWVIVLRRRVKEQTALLRESEQRFRHLALHDPLTGVATRLLLNDRLEAALMVAQRHQSGLALMMMDLDKFKVINDTFGHHVGDEVLRVTAARLLETVRKSDTVARMGGDEFVVLLPELEDATMVGNIAEKIVAALAVPVPFEGHSLPVSVSVGVCTASAGDLEAETILRNADVALYRAKERGRGCYEVFTPALDYVKTAEEL